MNRAVLIIVMLLGVVACQDRPKFGDTILFKDYTGDSILLARYPEHIISVSPSVTELLALLVDSSRIEATSTYCNYPESWARFKSVIPYPLSLESLVRLKPDLIVCKSDLVSIDETRKCKELGLPLVRIRFDSVEDILASISTLGQLTNTLEKAHKVNDSLKTKWDSIRFHGVAKERVLVLISQDLYAFGKSSYLQDLIAGAGGVNVVESAQAFPQLSRETIVRSNPDVLIIPEGLDLDQLVLRYPEFKTIKAFRMKRLYKINGDLLSRPGPRFVETCLKIQACLSDKSYNQ